jgi:homoserine O-acetyltransferase
VKITTKKETFTNPLYLESGRILEPYELVYETYGEMNDDKSNVVVVTHALTGSHHASGLYEGDRKPGWWDGIIGDGKSIDTEKYFVICVNVLGSCFGSTGPLSKEYPSNEPYRFKFPVVTIEDMVKAQRILFDKLGIYQVEAIVGGSMGGMQALVFAILYPSFAKKIIPLACTHASTPWVVAFNKIARESIIKDPDFKDGHYDSKQIKEDGLSGLSTGRMSGFISYLSPHSMMKKFDRKYVETDGLYELFGRYEIERYLEYNGNNFPKWFDPLSYLYITKAINIFDISRKFESLEDAVSNITSKLHLISFKKDMLFFPSEMKEIEQAMINVGKKDLVTYLEVNSEYGHGAYLVELDKFKEHLKQVLDSE